MYRGSASRSVDRPSLFVRKGINKRCGGTVYGARSHDKIGSCKSAGYLTGRRTIFEYPSLTALPSPPALFSTSCRSLVLPTRVLRVSSPRSRCPLIPGSSLLLHARRTIFLFFLSFSWFFSFFFPLFQGTRPVRSRRTPDSFTPKDNKARTRLTRYQSPNKYAPTLQ